MRFHPHQLLITVAALVGGAALPLPAQIIPISFTGTNYSQNFDGMGPAGTTTPAGWYVSRGSNGSFIMLTNGPLVVNNGAVGADATVAWNCGSSGATDRSLGIAATSTGVGTSNQERYVFFFLRNNTGSAFDTFELRYKGEQWRTPSAGSSPTFNTSLLYSTNLQNFYSMGTNFALPCLQYTPVSTPLDGNAVANSRYPVGGLFTLPAPLTNGGVLSFWWFDANESGTDPVLAIDDFTFALPSGPPALVSSPTNVAAAERDVVTLRTSVTGAGLNYQWYRNGTRLTNFSFCTNGHDRVISGANGPNLGFSNIEPIDAGQYHCIVTNLGGSVTSLTATVTVSADFEAPRIRYASVGANPTHFILHLSEPLDDECLNVGGGLVSQGSSWYIDEIFPGGGEDSLGCVGLTNMPSVTGARTLGLIAGRAPSSPSNPIRITLVTDLITDTATAQNPLPFGTTFYVNNSSNELVAFNHLWRYDDTDVDPGPGWFLPGFNAGAFPEGPGPFDAKRDAAGAGGPHCRDNIGLYGLGAPGTCLRLLSPLPPGTNNLLTANFWTHFQFVGDPATATFRWHGKLDDGAVIYLNGQELQRVRLPAAPAVITRTTLATAGVLDTDAEDAFEFIGPPGLRHGDNLLAVELHQSAVNSSDLTLAMNVYAFSAPLPALQLDYADGNVTVTWQPDFGQLEYSDTLAPGSWSAVPGGFNGYYEPAAGNRFFRVRMP